MRPRNTLLRTSADAGAHRSQPVCQCSKVISGRAESGRFGAERRIGSQKFGAHRRYFVDCRVLLWSDSAGRQGTAQSHRRNHDRHCRGRLGKQRRVLAARWRRGMWRRCCGVRRRRRGYAAACGSGCVAACGGGTVAGTAGTTACGSVQYVGAAVGPRGLDPRPRP